MATTVFEDQAKTIEIGESSFFVSKGTETNKVAKSDIHEMYADGVKLSNISVSELTANFNSFFAGTLVTLLPKGSVKLYFDSNSINAAVASIFVDTDTEVVLMSEDIQTGRLGDLELSLDGILFVPCITVAPGTDIEVVVRASHSVPELAIRTLTTTRLVVIESDLPISSAGYVEVNITPLPGETGLVEFHEIKL